MFGFKRLRRDLTYFDGSLKISRIPLSSSYIPDSNASYSNFEMRYVIDEEFILLRMLVLNKRIARIMVDIQAAVLPLIRVDAATVACLQHEYLIQRVIDPKFTRDREFDIDGIQIDSDDRKCQRLYHSLFTADGKYVAQPCIDFLNRLPIPADEMMGGKCYYNPHININCRPRMLFGCCINFDEEKQILKLDGDVKKLYTFAYEMYYLISRIIKPRGYRLDGEIAYCHSFSDAVGVYVMKNNIFELWSLQETDSNQLDRHSMALLNYAQKNNKLILYRNNIPILPDLTRVQINTIYREYDFDFVSIEAFIKRFESSKWVLKRDTQYMFSVQPVLCFLDL